MEYLQKLQRILQEYEQAVQEVQKKRRIFDGMLGLGNHPGNAACHDTLDQQTEKLCTEVSEEGSAEEAAALVEAIFGAEGQWEGPEYARLMLIAIQRHTIALAERMGDEARQKLAARYEKEYPRSRRLPVQEQVLKCLRSGKQKKTDSERLSR